jgi:uncharacterized protein (TIGR02246 family)
MTQLRRIATAASIGAAMLAYATATPAQPAPDRADEDAIRKVITEMTTGFNSHDGRAASMMYLSDAKLTTVRGEVMKGQAEIEKGLSAIFATRAKNAAHRTLDVSVKFIRPDVALAHVTNELSGLIGPDGQGLPSHRELSLRVFVKEGGHWRVAAFHNTMVRPFASAPR